MKLSNNLYEYQKKYFRELKRHLLSKIYYKNLHKLSLIHKTDKRRYAQYYHKHFQPLREKKLNILEIGVGGYENSLTGGNSLRMWKHYFPNSNIYAIDIHEKSRLQEKRIKIFKGSQEDEKFLNDVFNKTGFLDIIIDDGSHINEHIISSFKILFPLLKNGGIYVVEDTQTSYWPDYGGDSKNLNNPLTAMNFFKGLTDCLNYEEFILPGYKAGYFDKNIASMHFYHNAIFIYKGINRETRGINNG
ncbi:MAG: class I SAM-dependent methyltransferase [Candidatus Omnitrophota bacterium]